MEKLGKRLKNLREKTRFTQEEVAKMLGVQRLVITNIENGTRKVTAEELYTGEDKEKQIAKFSRNFEELSNKNQKEVLEFIKFKRYMEDNK